jgi:poly-gamma-glutamate capsule biosynthesis protein CapA/YwtB (metallophosphatase superfamily)
MAAMAASMAASMATGHGAEGAVTGRAIAQWIDRYLVPHGIRTQAIAVADGCLEVTVDCRREPERDRLMGFICHRLRSLNLVAVQGVRVVARQAGEAAVLWQAVEPLSELGGAGLAAAPADLEAAAFYYQWQAPRPVARQVALQVAKVAATASEGLSTWVGSVPQAIHLKGFPGANVREAFQGRSRDRVKGAPLEDVARWLDPILCERGWRGQLGSLTDTCLDLELAFPQVEADRVLLPAFRQVVLRTIAHRLWQLGQPSVQGVRVRAVTADGSDRLLWQQTVRIATPSGRRTLGRFWATALQAGAGVLADPAWQKILRSLLLGGTAIAPFFLALWLTQQAPQLSGDREDSSTRAGRRPLFPGAQVEQLVDLKPQTPAIASAVRAQGEEMRPRLVPGALELLKVERHTAVANPEDPTVTLMFGGDVTLSNHFAAVAGDRHDLAFGEMEELRRADLAMVNMENPLTRATTRRPGKTFNFKSDPESVNVLKTGGVDLVTLANNHTMDYNGPGLKETMKTLEAAGIHAIGAGREITEARRPKILEIKGQRIAFFGYYNAHWHAATASGPGTNPRDFAAIAADLKAVRPHVDWVVVNFHWGEEGARFPAGYQMEIARHSIDSGADVIVGHHPHVLQGTEIYKGRPIAYSLGNFIFGGNSRRDYDTAVLKVSLTGRQLKAEMVPVAVRGYQAKVAQGDRAAAIAAHINSISRHFRQPMGVTKTLEVPAPAGREGVVATAPAAPVTPVAAPATASAAQPKALSAAESSAIAARALRRIQENRTRATQTAATRSVPPETSTAPAQASTPANAKANAKADPAAEPFRGDGFVQGGAAAPALTTAPAAPAATVDGVSRAVLEATPLAPAVDEAARRTRALLN